MAHKRDLILVSGGRLASALIALVAIRAVTSFLTPEQYGELALLIAVQSFCGLFLVSPVGLHINLHTHAWWDDGTLMPRLKSYRQYVRVVSLVGMVVVLGMGKQQTVQQLLWSAAAMFGMVYAGTWNATLISMLNMLGFRAASVWWSIITAALALAASIFLVMWLPFATAWFAGQAIGLGLGAFGAQYVLRQHAMQAENSKGVLPLLDRRTVLTYCLPLAVATGLMWLQLSGYRFVIEGYWGMAQLGFVAVGLQLAGQIWMLAESLSTQFLTPLFYRRVAAHDNNIEVELAFSDLINTLVPVYCVLTGLLILSAPYLLKVLVATQFQNATGFVMLGAGIEICRVLGNLLSNAAHVRRKTKSLALPYAVGAMVSLLLVYQAGVRQEEVAWAGVALLAGACAMLVVMAAAMYKQVKFSLDIVRCSVGVAVMAAMALLGVWLPKPPGIGASIAILMLMGSLSSIAVLALLWKNPAALRLLAVQLRKK